MANPLQKTKGQRYAIEIGDGAVLPEAEQFTRIGLINTSASIASVLNVEEAELADLDDFDKPFFIDRETRSHDLTVEGSGNIDQRYVADLLDLHMGERAGQSVNLKLKQVTDAGGWTITCKFILQNFAIDATYGSMSTCQLSFVKAGIPTFTRNV